MFHLKWPGVASHNLGLQVGQKHCQVSTPDIHTQNMASISVKMHRHRASATGWSRVQQIPLAHKTLLQERVNDVADCSTRKVGVFRDPHASQRTRLTYTVEHTQAVDLAQQML